MFYTYDIFDDLLGLRDIVGRFFDEIPAARRARGIEFPYINLYEKDDRIVVKVLIPGVNQNDINVELTDAALVIGGKRKADLVDMPYIRREREFGEFRKSIKLPYAVDRNRISANLANGILTVTLEKSEDARTKRIEIK